MTKINFDNTIMEGNCPSCDKEFSLVAKVANRISTPQHCNICGKVSLGSNFNYH